MFQKDVLEMDGVLPTAIVGLYKCVWNIHDDHTPPLLGIYNASPPKVDRLDVAGGLTPGLSEPGNKESTGNLTV